MRISRPILMQALAGILCLAPRFAMAQDEAAGPALPPVEILISVPDQRLVVLRDGGLIAKYPVSTSRFGIGDNYRSYKTPVGRLKVYDKIGDDLPAGAVIKHRSATGEVLAANAPGRDPIVTREIWLEGTEEQNAHAKDRAIYIHGTPEESNIGKPVSWGCIRMRSEDVIALYNEVGPGTVVDISADRLPHLHKYKAPPPPPPAPPPEPQVQPNQPAPAQPTGGEQPVTGLLAKLFSKSDVKQPVAPQSQPQPQPAPVAEKQVPLAKVTSHPKPPAVAPEANFHDSGAEETPKNSYNTEAWHAMKGSILLAGLPAAAPAPSPAPVAQQSAQQPPK